MNGKNRPKDLRLFYIESIVNLIDSESDIREYLVLTLPKNKTIRENFRKAFQLINDPAYERIDCSLSGGSDSTLMADIIWKCDIHNKVNYIYFDTGIESQINKDSLKIIEDKYGIEIKNEPPVMHVANAVMKYGQPFMSKYITEMLSRLQSHGFQWEDEPYEVLNERYPKCSSALKWWCNLNGEKSSFNINRSYMLKEFIINNPPWFKISGICCKKGKKETSARRIKQNNTDLMIVGERKAEGGVRATNIKGCFSVKDECDEYRPVFWYSDEDKQIYKTSCNVKYSDLYEVFGLSRSGCIACPFGSRHEEELKTFEEIEPKKALLAKIIFADSYEYSRMYKKYKKQHANGYQYTLFDYDII